MNLHLGGKLSRKRHQLSQAECAILHYSVVQLGKYITNSCRQVFSVLASPVLLSQAACG